MQDCIVKNKESQCRVPWPVWSVECFGMHSEVQRNEKKVTICCLFSYWFHTIESPRSLG